MTARPATMVRFYSSLLYLLDGCFAAPPSGSSGCRAHVHNVNQEVLWRVLETEFPRIARALAVPEIRSRARTRASVANEAAPVGNREENVRD